MNLFLLDESVVEQNGQQSFNWGSTLGMLAFWAVVIFAMYFLLIRPSKKRQKQEEELRKSIEIGDDVTTIGGIVGRIIAVRDDDETFIIETGSDKTRMRFKKWAIASVDTPDKQPKKPEPKQEASADDQDDKKKKDRKKDKKSKSEDEQ